LTSSSDAAITTRKFRVVKMPQQKKWTPLDRFSAPCMPAAVAHRRFEIQLIEANELPRTEEFPLKSRRECDFYAPATGVAVSHRANLSLLSNNKPNGAASSPWMNHIETALIPPQPANRRPGPCRGTRRSLVRYGS
jgi:hypothetical protein